jgi:hypothetical protein
MQGGVSYLSAQHGLAADVSDITLKLEYTES